jgi:hypothetical protein
MDPVAALDPNIGGLVERDSLSGTHFAPRLGAN